MSIVCIARQHNKEEIKFKVSYLKNSVWLRDNGDARVMLHCVIRPSEESASFNSLRIVVSGDVTEPKDTSDLLLDEEHMKVYEDAAKYEVLSKEKSHIRGNGGEYFVTNVAFSNINPIGGNLTDLTDLTEFTVKLADHHVPPQEARGFRIEFTSHQYAKKRKKVDIFRYNLGLYGKMIQSLQELSPNYPNSDIMEVEYSDLWVILPRKKISSLINPNPDEIIEDLSYSPVGYSEWNIEKYLKGRDAYRWRTGKCNSNISGPGIYGEFLSAPLSKWYTYLAIALVTIGILIAIFTLLHVVF